VTVQEIAEMLCPSIAHDHTGDLHLGFTPVCETVAERVVKAVRDEAPLNGTGLRTALRFHNLHQARGDQHCHEGCADDVSLSAEKAAAAWRASRGGRS
jgi:dissimilatory sulfite reductase (desulfoviridin) alpha/beta subunit